MRETKIFWGDAFTYIDQIENRPGFIFNDIVKRNVNIKSYIKWHYNRNIEYGVRDDKSFVIYNNYNNYNEPRTLKFRKVTPEDKLEDIKDDCIYLDIPSLNFNNTKGWVIKAFDVFKGRKIFTVMTSMSLLKFPFYAIEVNVRKIAGFNEIILPTGRRVKTDNKLKVIESEKYLSALGYKIEDVYNIECKKRIKINMESYKMAVKYNQDPINTKKQIDKFKVKQPKKGKSGIYNNIHKVSSDRRSDIGRNAVVARHKNNAIKKMEMMCTEDEEFRYLVPYFKSRDSDLMLHALSEIMSIDSQRYLRGVRREQDGDGTLDTNVTSLSDSLFRHAESLAKMIKPSETSTNVYNILNYKVNVGMAVENLINAGLTKKQREDLAGQIDQIIKDQKRERASGIEMVTQ